MQSTVSMKDADPHDVFAIEPNFTPARTEQAAPSLAPGGTGAPGLREPYFGPSSAASPTPPAAPTTPTIAAVPPAAPAYYTAPPSDVRLDDIKLDRAPPPTNKWAVRAFWFMFAIISAMGATAWQHYGDRAKQLVAEFAPQVAQLASLIPGKAAPAADQASAATAPTAAVADQPAAEAAVPATPPQVIAATTVPTTAAAPVGQATPAAAAAVAPDQTQLLQSMARDLASMGAQIEQLKASIDQLKAGQDQMSQRVARTTETRAIEPRPAAPPRPRVTPPPAAVPHAAVTPPPVRRPAQAYIPPPPPPVSAAPLPPRTSAPQSAAPLPAPSQQQSSVVDADDGGPVVRPPMPLR